MLLSIPPLEMEQQALSKGEESSNGLTNLEYDPSKFQPRWAQYKKRASKMGQEERRKITLESQKKRRYDFHSHCRRLEENDFDISDEEKTDSDSEVDETMEYEVPKIRKPRAYKDQIMLSEWLVEVPTDFDTSWLMVPCPVGKRCLIVASRGSTRAYSRSGYKVSEFQSLLPGGSSRSTESSILDCLWNEKKQTYYVLDVLSWNKVPMLGCEAEFRIYWLESKFRESPDYSVISKKNPYRFIRMPFTSCKTADLESFMRREDLSIIQPLDGLLFYHKQGIYIPCASPLVCWLKPHMLPEKLGVSVPEIYQRKTEKMCH